MTSTMSWPRKGRVDVPGTGAIEVAEASAHSRKSSAATISSIGAGDKIIIDAVDSPRRAVRECTSATATARDQLNEPLHHGVCLP